MKIKELIGEDIINAYDGDQLSDDFGYSCANFNCDYQRNINKDVFKIYVENTNNISCFVYINDEGKIEGRRMFFKGKQLLDHKLYPIETKLNEEIYYLYGYYGNTDNQRHTFEEAITDFVLNKYGNNKIIYLDYGYFKNKTHVIKKGHWVMQIDNMDYEKFPSIDFIYASFDITSFSNFKPSLAIKEWLGFKYNDDNKVNFGVAYSYEPHGSDSNLFNFNQHWNQKHDVGDDDDDRYDDD